MKRLAVIVVAVGMMGFVGTVGAEPGSNGASPADCPRKAETLVRAGVEDTAYLHFGFDTRRRAPNAFLCYMVPAVERANGVFAGVVSAWVDPEYGRAGVNCTKRKGWDPPTGCPYYPVHVPGARGTTPVEHPEGPWMLYLGGINIGYALDDATVSASIGVSQDCNRRLCVDGDGIDYTGAGAEGGRATVRRGLQYRMPGWECSVEGGGACTRSHEPVGATIGEQHHDPTVAAGPLALEVPAVCVEASADVRC